MKNTDSSAEEENPEPQCSATALPGGFAPGTQSLCSGNKWPLGLIYSEDICTSVGITKLKAYTLCPCARYLHFFATFLWLM